MKSRIHLSLTLAVLLAGCLSTQHAQPLPAPSQVVLDRLATALEGGKFERSQRFVTVAARTFKDAKVAIPEGYDELLQPWVDSNKDLTDADCKEMAKKLRGLR